MIKKEIREEILKAAREAGFKEPVDFSVENPPTKNLGDFSTNIALVIAGEKKENPKEIAEKIKSKLSESQIIEKVSVAGAGFINIVIQNHTCYEELAKIISEKNDYGKQNLGVSKKVSIDYISANPTGPIHIGNARGGPIGEAIARLMEHFDYTVSREFYLNDIGIQINHLGETLYYWFEKKNGSDPTFPEDGYQGEYTKNIADKIFADHNKNLERFKSEEEMINYLKEVGLNHFVNNIKREVSLLNIKFDEWVSEKELQISGLSEKTIARLKENKATVNREGAIWFKNDADPSFQDKESVLIKSDQKKTFTYFADDITYHLNRYDQGVDLIIDVWGSNHHGHVARMRSALKSLGIKEDQFKVLLYQFIRIKNGDEIVKMSKRTGNFVTLGQVLDGGVAPDAFKYFILSQNPNTPFDFDMKLACDKSEKNPVYYIQYAHARICSILRKAGEIDLSKADLSVLKNDKELTLIKTLIEWPDIAEEILANFQVQALPHYAYKIAEQFHDFYTNCPVLDSEEKTKKARLALINAVKIVLNIVLSICNITAPEKM